MHHATSPSSYNIKHFRFLCDRRAVWCVLSPIVFDNDGTGEKARWKEDARQKLYSAVDKAVAGVMHVPPICDSPAWEFAAVTAQVQAAAPGTLG